MPFPHITMLKSFAALLRPKRLVGPIVCGIDNGTQSTKVVCYDVGTRRVAALAQAPHDLICRDDGTREQKASWWTDALSSCFKSIDPAIRSRISAIGVSGQQHGFVPVDASGNVLYNVKLWCDTSTVSECEAITTAYGGREQLLSDQCNLILPGYTAGKILWLKRHKPDAYQKMRHILLPHDYLNFILTGEYTMEFGDASGTALLDIGKRTWSQKLLKSLDSDRDLGQCLPKLIQAHEVSGVVSAEASKKFGIPQGAIVSSGGGDNMMCAIGTGTVADGVLAMSLGTSATIFGASSRPIVDMGGNLAAFCSSTGGWLPLMCTMNCTVASELTRELFGMSIDEINKVAEAAEIGCEGVTMVPFFNGERTPNYPNGKGCIVGLTPENMKKANISRAAMESAIYGLKLGLDSFVKLGFNAKEIRLVGGGAKSRLWRQIVADVCNLPVVVPKVGEAAAFGAALQAFWALERKNGGNVSIEDITKEHVELDTGLRCVPNEENGKKYSEAYERYLKYVHNFAPMFK